MNYTNKNDYGDYFGFTQEQIPTNYYQLEDVAVILLKDECGNFPTAEEFNRLELEVKKPLTLAIYYQIQHLSNNPSIIGGGSSVAGDYTSLSLGRFSISRDIGNQESEVNEMYNSIALKYLSESGICGYGICEHGICGCDICC